MRIYSAYADPKANRPSARIASLGLIAENESLSSQSTPVSQLVHIGGIYLYAGEVVTNVVSFVQVAGAGTTPTSIKMGLWSSAATPVCLAVTNDQAATGAMTSTGYKSLALTSPYTVPSNGIYYVCWWQNGTWGTTQLQLGVTVESSGTAGLAIGSSTPRGGSAKSGAATMVVNDTGSYSSGATPWFGVS